MNTFFQRLIFWLAVWLLPVWARADVGLVLNSSIGTGSSWVTSAGHSSIYLSRVCAETPVKARMCRPGEQGSVLSNYSNFHEDKPYEWNLVPASVFLFGVDDAADRPLYATAELQDTLQQHYRETHLGALCATENCRVNPDANWRDMVGATFTRTVYIFEVKTTVEQDEALVRRLNESPNANHYHGYSDNCADFAKDILNSYFPAAVHSNRLNDFGSTSPKAVARSLTHYADQHTELQLRVTRFEQLPSQIRRSDPARIATETVFTTKKFLLPMLLRPEELAVMSASYLVTGRFSAEHAAERHHADEELEDLQLAHLNVPNKQEGWAYYRTQLERQESEARELGVVENDRELARAFAELNEKGVPWVDGEGRPWMNLPLDQSVGLTVSSVEKPASEDAARMEYKLQLARVRFYLHSRGMDREGLPEFRQDWALLQDARDSFVRGHYNGDSALAAASGGRGSVGN